MKNAKMMLAVMILILLVACSRQAQKSVVPPSASIALIKVDTIWVPLEWRKSTLENRNYSFEFEGIVESVFVKPGEAVKPGDRIATLRSSDLVSRITSQKIALNSSERELKRVNQLFEQQARTAVQRESVQVVVATAREQLQFYENELKNRTIYAKKSGKVISLERRSAEYAEKGSIVAVVDESQLQEQFCSLPSHFASFVKDSVAIKVIGKDAKCSTAMARLLQADTSVQLHFQSGTNSNAGLCLLPVTGNIAKLSGIALRGNEIVEVVVGNTATFAFVVKSSGSDAWVVLLNGSLKPGGVDRVIR